MEGFFGGALFQRSFVHLQPVTHAKCLMGQAGHLGKIRLQIQGDGALIRIEGHIIFCNLDDRIRYAAGIGIGDLQFHLLKVDTAVRGGEQQGCAVCIIQG